MYDEIILVQFKENRNKESDSTRNTLVLIWRRVARFVLLPIFTLQMQFAGKL